MMLSQTWNADSLAIHLTHLQIIPMFRVVDYALVFKNATCSYNVLKVPFKDYHTVLWTLGMVNRTFMVVLAESHSLNLSSATTDGAKNMVGTEWVMRRLKQVSSLVFLYG